MSQVQTFQPVAAQPNNRSHAVVIGGSMAGLLAARVLTNHFDQVTVVERDSLSFEISQSVGDSDSLGKSCENTLPIGQPELRRGVPQASHVHVLLTQGQRTLEQLFPGLEAELAEAGAPVVDWTADWLFLGLGGWAPRYDSGLSGRTCSRSLLEWLVRRRLKAYNNLQFLDNSQVKELLTLSDRSRVTGVSVSFQDGKQEQEITADLVVDASGRNSFMPQWLEALGYAPPQETTINAFLGYGSCWYQPPEGFQVDWQGITVTSKPPDNGRGGVLYPVEGNRWVVTLGGIGRDYPPTDQAGFLEFARSLRSPIIYEVIKNAKPLSPIYSYRRTENRLRHYERSKLPEGLVVVGDAVCAFNPVYGQGMSVAALGALTLDRCLHEQFQHSKDKLISLTQRFQKQLAHLVATPWMMATGEDVRWSTTEGGKPTLMNRLMQRYVDQVMLVSTVNLEVHRTFVEVVHMVKPPTALFQPTMLAQVLGHLLNWRTSAASKVPGQTATIPEQSFLP